MTLSGTFRSFASKLVVGAALALAVPAASHAQLAINIRIGPPALPVYVQPICPGEGYIWTPGYWAWGPEGYYWIPGTWVLAPEPGFLWTPAYWGWDGGFYRFHEGYWGRHIGFYGGINYGFGYFGTGFEGGEWRGNHFFYNTAVGNYGGAHITNVYVHNVTIVNNNRASFNGGPGGVQAKPQIAELNAANERHVQPTPMQQQHFQAAAQDRGQLASVNGGRPQMTAARTPQEFTQHVNAIPQAQRVAPGAPGERFHPGAQPAAPQNNQHQPNAPQNRMQPVVPQQQRIVNQPQAQPQQQPRQPMQAQPQQQVRPQQAPPQQPRPQAQPQPQPRPQQAPPQQPRPQAQPQQHAAPPAPHEAPREERGR